MKNEAQEAIKKTKSLENGFPSFLTFNLEAFLASWVQFYQDAHGISVDPSSILLPDLNLELGAGVVMAGNITIEQGLAGIKKLTPSGQLYHYTDESIDKIINRQRESSRPNQPYAAWAYPALEATDQALQLAKKSYLENQKLAVPVMNYNEYVRFAHWHLWATGIPLDRRTVTLSDSLVADSHVLSGDWGDGFRVGWSRRQYSGDGIRFRQVILPPLA